MEISPGEVVGEVSPWRKGHLASCSEWNKWNGAISGSWNQSVVGKYIIKQEFLDDMIKNILVWLAKEIFLLCNSWIASSEVGVGDGHR